MITPEKRFFASYTRDDRALVGSILTPLRAPGQFVFLDLDNPASAIPLPDRLDLALAEATTFVVFWSRSAARSEWMTGEWRSAIAAGKEIIPVLLDATPVPEALRPYPGVMWKDLTSMKQLRGAQTTALFCCAALIAAAVAISLVSMKFGAWPGTSVPAPAKANLPQPPPADVIAPEALPAATAPNETIDPETHLRELLSKGRQLREGGDATAALTKFQEAAAIDENNPVAFVELAVTTEGMGMAQQAIAHWQKVHSLGAGAGLYFSLAEAKLKAANALTPPAAPSDADESPDLTSPVVGITSGSVMGLMPITRDDQLDSKSAAHFILNIPVKARPKIHIDVHELIVHVLFYELVDGKRIEQTAANVKSRWLAPPTDWVSTDTEVLAVDYQLPKPPTVADEIVDRKYFGYIVRLYYKEVLQAAVAEPQSLAKLHPPPPTVTGEPAKPTPPPRAPLPRGAFRQTSPVALADGLATPAPGAPPNKTEPVTTTEPAKAIPAAAPTPAEPLPVDLVRPFVIPSALALAGLGLASLIGFGVARGRDRRLGGMIMELAARRLATALARPIPEAAPAAEISGLPPADDENIPPIPDDDEGNRTSEPPEDGNDTATTGDHGATSTSDVPVVNEPEPAEPAPLEPEPAIEPPEKVSEPAVPEEHGESSADKARESPEACAAMAVSGEAGPAGEPPH